LKASKKSGEELGPEVYIYRYLLPLLVERGNNGHYFT
jgi:hypothetical protein